MRHSPYSGANTRRNVIAFLVGKIPNALLTAAILTWTVRLLDVHQYGIYIAAMAALEMVANFSTLGCDWILVRYVPECRVANDKAGIWRLLGLVVSLRIVLLIGPLLAIGSGVLHVSLPRDAAGGGLAWLFCALVLTECVMRLFRDNMLEALALQGYFQFISFCKGCVILCGLHGLSLWQIGSAQGMLMVEICAAGLVLILSVCAVWLGLGHIVSAPGGRARRSVAQMCRMALYNYFSSCVEYLYSPSCLLVVLAKFQPPHVVAGAGFLVRIVDIIRNYTPGMLLLGVVRARMIGTYSADHNYPALRRWADFLYKASALSVLPVCGLVALFGREVVEILSGGKYGEYRWFWFALTVWLLLRLHRLILAILHNAIDRMRDWMHATVSSLLILPVAYLCWADGFGAWQMVAVLATSELVINGVAVCKLHAAGYVWAPLGGWLFRAVGGTLLACLLTGLGREHLSVPLLPSVAIYALAYCAWVFWGVMEEGDKELINRAAGRNIFRIA